MEFRDLKRQYRRLQPQLDRAVLSVLCSGEYVMGPAVERLEQRLAAACQRRFAVSCANGTDALTLSLMALGLRDGEGVFVPALTFFATAEAVVLAGGEPVFVDVDPVTYNISPAALERAVSRIRREGRIRPRGVIAVDLFGLPADYDAIEVLAAKQGLFLLEDAAQSFGASRNGRRAGSFGVLAATSFFPAKPLGCYGDGGAVFTDDLSLAKKLRSLRFHGRGQDKYHNETVGLNSRLDTIQAAVLEVKLAALEQWEAEASRDAAEQYGKALEHLTDHLALPCVPAGFQSAWAQYTVRLKDALRRDSLMSYLAREGIPSAVYYPVPLHRQRAFASLARESDCPVAENLCSRLLSLPMGPYLEREEIEKVSSVMTRFFHAGP